LRAVGTLAQAIASQVREGKAVVIRCQARMGRSSLIAAGVVIYPGLSADDAPRLITVVQGIDVSDAESGAESGAHGSWHLA
jgi:protein-tyrosine phosphatase